MTWWVVITAIIMLLGCFVCIFDGSTTEDKDTRWILSLAALIMMIMGASGMTGACCFSIEALSNEEKNILREYRIKQQQKELAKELSELNKGIKDVGHHPKD